MQLSVNVLSRYSQVGDVSTAESDQCSLPTKPSCVRVYPWNSCFPFLLPRIGLVSLVLFLSDKLFDELRVMEGDSVERYVYLECKSISSSILLHRNVLGFLEFKSPSRLPFTLS